MSTPQYTKENCSVFTWNSVTGMLEEIGTATVQKTIDRYENKAAKDTFKRHGYGAAEYSVDADIRATLEEGNLFTKVGQYATLTITMDGWAIIGSFGCDDTTYNMSDGHRWQVKLSSDGVVTES